MSTMTAAEEQANRAAELLPMTTSDERPALRLPFPADSDDPDGTVLVFGYWRDGELTVTVDTEDAELPVDVRLRINDGHLYRGTVR